MTPSPSCSRAEPPASTRLMSASWCSCAWLALLLSGGVACGEPAPVTSGGNLRQGDRERGDGDASGDEGDQGDGDADDDEDLASGDGDSRSGDGDAVHSGENCPLGEAGSYATDQSLDLFGDTIYFANGGTLPKGRYRVSYEDGCMKYNATFTWTVNAIFGGDGWWLVGASTSDRVLLLPGLGGLLPGMGGFTVFEECVQANKALEPKEFDWDGGKLGIYLNDAPYDDNGAGEGGRNPKWKLEWIGECTPELVELL